ncbi:hypothetical protein JMK10_15285 [Rhodovulum sulfidophilum]|uniref:hypothetical protein n=1 Tax=Rhodovulum sulfidophilum TaxID=35806 RepID=UPI001922A9BB|nr:hypothetical protein [Rhodovulum sulfidophilum]MBL3574913.1 hypothetical protein [Rhodovulum sulfidophilum]MCE8431058.1 hypothetical protein [Rhodovulum sulfidophilum]MCF4118143.1 hypothetical protein [Rhodovulum sulfidophilum]
MSRAVNEGEVCAAMTGMRLRRFTWRSPDVWIIQKEKGEHSQMSSRIDHKDEPGLYRDAVFQEVRQQISFVGSAPESSHAFLGDWVCRLQSINAEPLEYRSFFEDGRSPGKMVDGTSESPNDQWKLNEDGSFSEIAFIEVMPEFDMDEPSFDEQRYHVLFRDKDTFVLFNGDGSLIKFYERVFD